MTALARAAVGGFGSSFGRDAYRTMKKQGLLLAAIAIAAAAVALPFLGGRHMIRGHDRGWFLTLALTVIGSLLLITLGAIAAVFVDIVLLSFIVSEDSPAVPPRYGLIAAAVAMSTGIGLLIGLAERKSRLRGFHIARENERFLLDQGFIETGGNDVTHRDGDGTPLRLLEATRDSVVFMVVGRRGKRAFITLDSEGRMLSYSGAQT